VFAYYNPRGVYVSLGLGATRIREQILGLFNLLLLSRASEETSIGIIHELPADDE
jgi:hypothetical protein